MCTRLGSSGKCVQLIFSADPAARRMFEPCRSLHVRFWYRLQELEKEYESLKENDPAELEKVTRLTQVSSCVESGSPDIVYAAWCTRMYVVLAWYTCSAFPEQTLSPSGNTGCRCLPLLGVEFYPGLSLFVLRMPHCSRACCNETVELFCIDVSRKEEHAEALDGYHIGFCNQDKLALIQRFSLGE